MNVAIVTVSTRAARGVYPDRSGDDLAQELAAAGHRVSGRLTVPDGEEALAALLRELCDSKSHDVILTSGGTGISPTDRTPEATVAACERLVPGIAEAIRAASLGATAHAMLSRGVAGIRSGCLVVNLPGSPAGARDAWGVLAPIVDHAVSQIRGGDH